ncbi:hypothetical protein RJT13_06670 [Segatella copri]|uniref:hypothetical protein n=1 Tax=Segatella copri TaxID=165179 RepID=UPI0029167E27|nr:hypothetical protein [Segatella copri]MDV3121331.1 hypothetical protein [Segatella copri]
MSDVTFNIYGGNNQILPNATKAEQNFYGDQFAEKTLAKDGEAPQPLTEEEQALSGSPVKVCGLGIDLH